MLDALSIVAGIRRHDRQLRSQTIRYEGWGSGYSGNDLTTSPKMSRGSAPKVRTINILRRVISPSEE
jgi:hypothetical protein